MAKNKTVSGRKKWWDALPKEEQFARMQRISNARWEGMSDKDRKEHGRKVVEGRARAKKNV